MAINPPSDLVMDVARAADPQAYRMAAERLKSAASDMRTAMAASSSGVTREYFANLASGNSAPAGAQGAVSPAYRKFEAFMLQSFVQSMFTSDTSTTFGKGIAGEYWKSMMSEAMATKMADAGGVGIARMLEEQAARNGQAEAPVTAALGQTIEELGNGMSGHAVSKDIVHGFERTLIQKQLENKDETGAARG